jgi:AcrR family transcriptional regulator
VPRVVDHEERRREIGEAVWRAVARQGIEAATVRGIASEAGFSTGVLSHYFEGKDEMLVHALHVSIERAAGRAEARATGAGGIQALRAVLVEAMPLDEERREEFGVWLQFWGRTASSEALAAELSHWYALWRGVLQALIEEGQRTGAARADLDAGGEAAALVAFVDGIGIQATMDPDRFPPEEQLALLDRHLARLAVGNKPRHKVRTLADSW